ncbi:Serpin B6, partial [Lamellibrachia satsuma]
MRNHLIFLGAILIIGAIDVTSSYNVWRLARANGNFAFCMYSKIIQGEAGKNDFFSPFSVSTALAMTYAGARGQTAREMCRVLGFCPLKFNVHAMFRSTLGSMNAAQDQYTLALANGIFVDKNLSIRLSFRSFLAKYYSAGFKVLDFHGDSEGTAGYINEWVEDRTNDKIKDIVSKEMIDLADMALVNAIYFKGQWKCPFNPDITRTAMFQMSSDEEGPVKMMIQTARFRYSLNRRLDCQILELPYCGDRLAMYILLPTRTDGLASLERKLTFNSVNSALTKLRRRRLSVAVPVFEMTV